MPVVAVSGFSGSGKTRLLAKLIPALRARGVSTAVVKHTRHPHAFDRPGKDTEVLRRAGAAAAAIDGPGGMAFFGPPAGGLRAILRFLPPVDLVLAEGWKEAALPRVEVHRRSMAQPFLCAEDARVFAIVTDEPPPRPVPSFRPDEVEPLADLLCARFHLGARRAPARLRVSPAVSRVRAEGSGRTVAPGRAKRMAKMTRSRRGGRRSSGSRQGAGRKGGRATLRARGPEFFSEIGRKGGKKSGARRRASARSSGRMSSRSRG
ncbi:MAG TPA: molybdopterin-guanine dinucleotide biosynthesis protein B, partial [Anaeromyxobacter sp.]|nr:molybdopterin-guanine dinucleotide biosynthesis protein B [Anaeromyxobacter sp.]